MTATIYATSGCSLRENQPTTNLSTQPQALIGNAGGISVRGRQIDKFDFSAYELPICHATLNYKNTAQGSEFRTDGIFKAQRLLVTPTINEATWNKRDTATDWQTAGAYGALDVTDDNAATCTIDTATEDLEFDITDQVNWAIENNSGILYPLISAANDTTAGADYITIYTVNDAVQANRPNVVVWDNSVYYKCLLAVKAAIEDLDLPLDHSSNAINYLVRKVPIDRGLGKDRPKSLPTILICPQRDVAPPLAGTNAQDDVIYGIWVIILGADNAETTYVRDLDTYLLWREEIRRKFHNRPATVREFGAVFDNAEIINTTCDLASVALPDAWYDNLLVDSMVIRCTSRELRGTN